MMLASTSIEWLQEPLFPATLDILQGKVRLGEGRGWEGNGGKVRGGEGRGEEGRGQGRVGLGSRDEARLGETRQSDACIGPSGP